MKTVINNEGSKKTRILQIHHILGPATNSRYCITFFIPDRYFHQISKETN